MYWTEQEIGITKKGQKGFDLLWLKNRACGFLLFVRDQQESTLTEKVKSCWREESKRNKAKMKENKKKSFASTGIQTHDLRLVSSCPGITFHTGFVSLQFFICPNWLPVLRGTYRSHLQHYPKLIHPIHNLVCNCSPGVYTISRTSEKSYVHR